MNQVRRVLTRVQHRGETQIPQMIRDHLDLKEGDFVSWTAPETGNARIRKARISE